MKNVTLLVFSFFLMITAFAEKKIVDSKIVEVTVYPVGAMVNREVTVTVPAGENFIVLDNLTAIIDANTIQVGGSGDFEIVSVKFELFYPYVSSKPKSITGMEDSLELMSDELFLLRAEDKALDEEKFMILTNKNISSVGGSTLEDITAMADYYRIRFADISKQKLRNKNHRKEIVANQIRIRAVLSGMNSYLSERVGRIILETNSEKAVSANITFSYFTLSAGWFPKYNIKASSGAKDIDVDYHALVTQNTGVDWENVDLILSTTRPNMNNQKPKLHPWYLDYYSEYAVRTYENKLIDKGNTTASGVVTHEDFINMASRSATGVAANTAGVYAADDGSGNLNIRGARSSADYYYIDGMKVQGSSNLPKSAINEMSWDGYNTYGNSNNYGYQNSAPSKPKYSTGELVFNALNVSYKIASKYTVESNNANKQVFIKNIKIPTTFGHYAVPSMEGEAFLTASIIDWSSYDLIPGNATLFYNNTYVGKSYILSNTAEDTLQISLGRDRGVIVSRDKVKDLSTKKRVGGNLKKNFVYEITIRNTNSGEVDVVFFDRIPVSKRSGIVVSVGEIAGAEYNKETGIMKWKKTISGGESSTIRFDYEVKYPKNKVVNL